MNARTQITMDPELQRRAQAKAAELGISFPEYIRRLITQDVDKSKPPAKPPTDIFVMFDLIDEGPPTNIARDKDRTISGPKPRPDISAVFDLGASDKPTDIARDKDKMIGEAACAEYLRETGRGPPTRTVRAKPRGRR